VPDTSKASGRMSTFAAIDMHFCGAPSIRFDLMSVGGNTPGMLTDAVKTLRNRLSAPGQCSTEAAAAEDQLAMGCRGVEPWIIQCFDVGISRLDGVAQAQQVSY